MEKILEKYGRPPALRSAIARMHKDSVIRMIIGKIDTSIPFQVGVKKGESMAPVLFLIIITRFSETLEKEWICNGLHMLQFRRHDNFPRSSGRIISHPRRTFSEGTLFEIFCMLYVDNRAFTPPSRLELEVGSTVIRRHFAHFALEMHVGSTTKAYKTEAVFFPPPGFSSHPPSLPPKLPINPFRW